MRFRVPGTEQWRPPLGRLMRLARPSAEAVPLRLMEQLRVRLQPGAAPSPLAISLLTAIALHLLALSALQLHERRRPAAAVPPPRDDTPELLQFSRQQTREPALAPLSIAALAQLPPPPPPPLTAGGSAAALQAPAPRGTSGRAGDLRRAPHSPGRTRGQRATTAQPGSRNQTSSRPAARTTRLDPGLETALAALIRWQSPQSTAEGRTASGEAGWPSPQKPEAEQLALWTRLWEKASPAGSGAGLTSRLPAEAELRRLAASDSEAAALPEGGRLSLALGDRWLLIWSAGREVWLLQAPASRPESAGDRQEG
jgi:hypothetical protein